MSDKNVSIICKTQYLKSLQNMLQVIKKQLNFSKHSLHKIMQQASCRKTMNKDL